MFHNLLKQRHQVETKCSNTGAYGGPFTFKPQVHMFSSSLTNKHCCTHREYRNGQNKHGLCFWRACTQRAGKWQIEKQENIEHGAGLYFKFYSCCCGKKNKKKTDLEKGFPAAHSSRSELIVLGKRRQQELDVSYHITSTIKNRENKCMHVHLGSALSTLLQPRIQHREWWLLTVGRHSPLS